MIDPAVTLQPIINKYRRSPFRWGHTDCLKFSSECASEILGKEILPHLEYESGIGAARLLKKHDVTLENLYDRFLDTVPTKSAKRGDIVLIHHDGLWGKAMAVVTGQCALTTSETGLVEIPMKDWVKAWGVNQCHQ